MLNKIRRLLLPHAQNSREDALTPQQFAEHHLPDDWSEEDLQCWIYERLSSWNFGLIPYELEQNIATPSGVNRRADIESLFQRIEVKKYLDYDALYHALGQLYVYQRFGSKLFGLIPKQKVLIGLAPPEYEGYQSAANLKVDIEAMGVRVVWLNEESQWHAKADKVERCRTTWLAIAFLGFGLGIASTQLFLAPSQKAVEKAIVHSAKNSHCAMPKFRKFCLKK